MADGDMTERDYMDSVLFYLRNAVNELDIAMHNASRIKGPIYRKIDGIKNRINTIVDIEHSKRKS
jgi:hypothetical protein